MAETVDVVFTPLYAAETEEAITARWRAWSNEGLDPVENAEDWTDTREGSAWWVFTVGARRECARLYDLAGSEVVATGFPQWSWGEYLDDHGELRDVLRLAATPATGVVVFSGPEGTVIPAGTVVGVEPAVVGGEAPEFEVLLEGTIDATGQLERAVRARETGVRGRVGVGAITQLITPLEEVAGVTNTVPTAGGSDTENDSALSMRIEESFEGGAVANLRYYRQLALAEPGVGRVTVIRAYRGAGTIGIIVSTAAGDPVGDDVVRSLQARVDPITAQGAGEGQVGAEIIVSTAALLRIDVEVTIEFEPGYSAAGAAGTTGRQAEIEAAVGAYVDTVEPGGEVVRQQVLGRIVAIAGVHDVGNLRLNGAAANVAVSSDPAQAPALNSLRITTAAV